MKRWPLLLLSFFFGLLIAPALAYLYFAYGTPPVAVGDNPFPFEARVVRVPLHARIDREMPTQSAIPINDANLIAGARIYQEQCSSCHGLKDRPSTFGSTMFPRAPQLWAVHRKTIVGVSDDPAGETYWKVKNGIRLSGMPAYQSLLSDEQMWQVSLLLSVADKPIPQAATDLVSKP